MSTSACPRSKRCVRAPHEREGPGQVILPGAMSGCLEQALVGAAARRPRARPTRATAAPRLLNFVVSPRPLSLARLPCCPLFLANSMLSRLKRWSQTNARSARGAGTCDHPTGLRTHLIYCFFRLSAFTSLHPRRPDAVSQPTRHTGGNIEKREQKICCLMSVFVNKIETDRWIFENVSAFQPRTPVLVH